MTVSPHQALYRRWRAQRFAEIVGQEPVVATLRNAVRTGRLAHALLFVGPRGTGKTSLARIVAKALNCTDLRDGEPCDRCAACVGIREGRALDVIEMDAASNNRVDDIRELLPRIQTAPSDVRRKVFIVDEVQRIKEGWDVLLKTLEEPPDHVAFIFCTTDSSQVRPAVLSRVQRFDFRRLTVPEIEGKLATILADEGRTADPDALETIARLAEGGMRDAESMLDQVLASSGERIDAGLVRGLLGLAEADTVERFARALVRGDATAGLAILADLEDRGLDLRVFLDQVVEALRGSIAAAIASGGTADLDATAGAAAALAAIDPTRPGTGGLRLRLELILLTAHPGVPSRQGREGAGIVPTLPSDAPSSRAVATEAPAPVGRARPSPSTAPEATPAPSHFDAGGVEDDSRASDARPKRRRAQAGDAADGETSPAAPTVEKPSQRPEVGPSLGPEIEPSPGSEVGPSPRPEVGPSPRPEVGPPPRPEVGPPPRPEVEPVPLAARASPPPGTADPKALAALRDQWPEIVAYISAHPPTKPLISACRPIAVEGNVVTLGFPEGQGFLAEVARKRGAQLEAGIGHFLGRPVAVTCVATNVDLATGPTDAEGARLLAEARRIFADDLPDVEEVH